MKTMTVSTCSRSTLFKLDRNLTPNPPGIKITSKSKIKIPLTAAALVVLLLPALAGSISLETAPPVVVKTLPLAGATNVDPAVAEIKVTYSKAMQDGSWSWSTWGEENYPETTGQPRYLADARTCVLPVKLKPNQFYAIWLNSDKFKNFTDTGGQAAVPYLLTFFTGAGVGTSGTAATTGESGSFGQGYEYVVQPGDTLSKIAAAYAANGIETSVEAILWANPGLNQRMLKLGQKIVIPTKAASVRDQSPSGSNANLNEDQRAVLAWTDRQFRGYFDARTFEGWSEAERAELETKSIDALKGPRSQDYYRAINTLGALRSTKALLELRGIAYERADRNNRDRWMAIRALGMIGDQADVPGLTRLVYHGNVNTRWWAQISLVRITGKNFGKDWNAWGKWWNDQNGQPPYQPEIIHWWDGQPEPDKLAQSLEESDAKFLADLKGKPAAAAAGSTNDLMARIRSAEPTMNGIREEWTTTMNALDSSDNSTALAASRRLTPHIQDFLNKFRGTALEPGTAKALDLIKSLATALEKDDRAAVQTSRSAMATLGQSMEEQIKGITAAAADARNRMQTGDSYVEEQTKQAQAGNYWSKYKLWEAYSKGTRGVERNSADADKWLAEVVKGAYLAKFEPANGFSPKTPQEMLQRFNDQCQLRSGQESLGGASFFRTTKQDGKLIGSFLTELPDEFRKAIERHPDLKLISIEKLTPELFKAHESSRQESL